MFKILRESIAFVSAPFGRVPDIRISRAATGTAMIACALGCAVHSAAAEAATETVLLSFDGTDGANPFGTSLANVKGTLYGTTGSGGSYGNGTVFSLNPATGTETVLHSFGSGADGQQPLNSTLIKVKGKLYGITWGGGTYGNGTVFSVNPKTGAETVVYSFGSGTDGVNPEAGLINVGGTLYGTTVNGGGYGGGTVFSLNPETGTETVLYSFGSGTDGNQPNGNLLNVNGTLYGTAWGGGAYSSGTVFSFNPGTNTETILHSFAGGTDGANPFDQAGLINVKGTLYGTTESGGTGQGTVFSLNLKTGTETLLHSFGSGTDGQVPTAGLIRVKGLLYGTTSSGGTSNNGTVFSIDRKSGDETVLYSFAGGTTDGSYVGAGLTNVNGTLYGMTYNGGTYGDGTVYSIVP